MAEPLKNMYNVEFFEKLCPVLRATIPRFDCRDFIYRVFNNRWPDLELKERVRHIAVVLHHFLPTHFNAAAGILVKLSQALRKASTTEQGFATIFIPEYILVYGQEHPEQSLAALEEITKLVSAEFAIRPFLLQHREITLQKMTVWSKHADASVRRLSSEGCRPRLPWAMGIPYLKKDPAPILPILENLKHDPSEYVRRSVANNLNDIAKDHPDLVLNIVKKWRGRDANTDWIVKHGCRSLLKKGDEHALSLHGFNPTCKSQVVAFNLLKDRVRIGDYLNFEFHFVNLEKKVANFRLEYGIDYITSTGKSSRKVFKITENAFAPGETVNIRRKQSFKDFTTRKHFKGKHNITIFANGKKLASKEFTVF
jgi:3-methyladenine DNA glycosylase AlkC